MLLQLQPPLTPVDVVLALLQLLLALVGHIPSLVLGVTGAPLDLGLPVIFTKGHHTQSSRPAGCCAQRQQSAAVGLGSSSLRGSRMSSS